MKTIDPAKMEALKSFINNLKTDENKDFINSVVMEGLNVCFESPDITEDELKNEPNLIKIPEDPAKIDEAKLKMDEIKATEIAGEVKKEELKKITDIPASV